MKRILFLLYFVMPASSLFAQYQKQTDTTVNHMKPLISLERVNLLKNVDMIANMQYGLRNEFADGDYTDSRFSMNQFRLEIKGKVFDNVYFRFRDRYTRATEPQSLDGISHSTDMAFIQIDIKKKWSLAFGKMCADWGGYEFDLNPIDIYAYNDIVGICG